MGEREKNAVLLKEILKEINRLKSNCSVNSSIYILFLVHCLLLLLFLQCGESMHAIAVFAKWAIITDLRNEQLPNPAISELTNPQSYSGEPYTTIIASTKKRIKDYSGYVGLSGLNTLSISVPFSSFIIATPI